MPVRTRHSLPRRKLLLVASLFIVGCAAAFATAADLLRPASADNPTLAPLLVMKTADTEILAGGGTRLEVPPSDAVAKIPPEAAAAIAANAYGSAADAGGKAVREVVLAMKRQAVYPSNATLVWVVSLNSQPTFESPAAKYLDPARSFWVGFVDATTGENLGSMASGHLTDEGLRLQAEGKLPGWDDGDQLPADQPLYQPSPTP